MLPYIAYMDPMGYICIFVLKVKLFRGFRAWTGGLRDLAFGDVRRLRRKMGIDRQIDKTCFSNSYD